MFLDSKATLDIEGQSNTLIEINFQLYEGHFCLVINLKWWEKSLDGVCVACGCLISPVCPRRSVRITSQHL